MQTTKPVTKPSKQRKRLFQAPNHRRHKHFAAHLSPELRASHGVRAIPVRSGDTVLIMRGDHKGFEGKITRIDRKKYRIYVEGLTRETVDGTTIFVPIHPSKVMITRLNLDDKWRKKILERKKAHKKVEAVVEKPPEKVAETKEEIVKEKMVVREKTPKKKPKRRKKKIAKKPADKKKEEKPKRRKRVKKATKKKTDEAKKEEEKKVRKTKTGRKAIKKTEGGT
jgi:large subunit ribosomal protein L24